MRAGFHACVTWQSLQASDEGICLGGFVVALIAIELRLALWQPAHVVGVPLKIAPMWQVSQATA
jgi:hypothetical protein